MHTYERDPIDPKHLASPCNDFRNAPPVDGLHRRALELRCTVRALAATGRSRHNWFLTAASAIGTGMWIMHFVAMLGFSVTGTGTRYDVPLTLLSLMVAMVVVCAGAFAVGQGPDRGRALAGVTTGIGVASMHSLGMAAVRLHGDARALDLDRGTPVVLCDAHERDSGKEVLIRFVEQPDGCTPPGCSTPSAEPPRHPQSATSASASTLSMVTRTRSSPGTPLRAPNSSARSAPM